MGQTTHGLFFGTRAPEGVALRDDDNSDDLRPLPGLLDVWEAKRGAFKLPYRFGVVDHRPGDRDAPRLLGLWIAAGASGIRDIPCMGSTVTTFSLDNPAEPAGPYSGRLAWAKEEWDRFARWAAERGVKLWPAQLWLTTLEVS